LLYRRRTHIINSACVSEGRVQHNLYGTHKRGPTTDATRACARARPTARRTYIRAKPLRLRSVRRCSRSTTHDTSRPRANQRVARRSHNITPGCPHLNEPFHHPPPARAPRSRAQSNAHAGKRWYSAFTRPISLPRGIWLATHALAQSWRHTRAQSTIPLCA